MSIAFLKKTLVLIVVVALVLPGSAMAARRQGVSEFYINTSWFDATSVKFNNGSTLDIENDNGWRLGFGYNFDKNLELSGDFGWADAKFKYSTLDGTSNPVSLNGKMDIFDFHVNGTYNFIKGPLTPFVTGGLGFTFIDSGIPSGLPSTGCWYDPWYGYICTSYQPSYTDTSFSYKLGVGARWDVNSDIYFKGAYNQTWIDMSNTSNTPAIRSGSIDLGFMF